MPPDKITVNGNLSDVGAVAAAGVEVEIRLSLKTVFYDVDAQIVGESRTVLTDSGGEWTVDLVDTDKMSDNPHYIFTILKMKFKKTVPFSLTALNFTELPDVIV